VRRAGHDGVTHGSPAPQFLDQLVLENDAVPETNQVLDEVEYLRLYEARNAVTPDLPNGRIYLRVPYPVNHDCPRPAIYERNQNAASGAIASQQPGLAVQSVDLHTGQHGRWKREHAQQWSVELTDSPSNIGTARSSSSLRP